MDRSRPMAFLFIPCINDTWGILWYNPKLLPCLTLCVVFQSLARHIANLQWWLYLPQNFGSLKSMEGPPLTTLCVQVSDPTGINDGTLFSSAVPPGSGAFQMPTCPSSSSSSSVSVSSSAASTLRGGRANLRNASVTFSLFWHEASLGWH